MRPRHAVLRLHTDWADRHPSRSVLAWVLVAWVLATLAPGLSRCLQHMAHEAGQAVPRTAPVNWVEVCGPQGMHWVRLNSLKDPLPEQPSDSGESMDACAHCVLAADRLAPLMPPDGLSLALSVSYGLPDWAHKPIRRSAWSGIQARGPPALF